MESRTNRAVFITILAGVLAILLAIEIFFWTTSLNIEGNQKELLVTSDSQFFGNAAGRGGANGIRLLGSADAGDNVNEPTAYAGTDQTVSENTLVTLDGTGSSDPNDDDLTYSWTQIGTPSVTLSSSISSMPTFTAPNVSADTILIFELIVNDGDIDSSADSVIITVRDIPVGGNTAPVANAGADQTLNENVIVTLNGTASSDADGNPLTYLWAQTAGPSVILSSLTSATPTFTAPSVSSATTLTFSLVVNDGLVNSLVADSVNIIVNDVPVGGNSAPVAIDVFANTNEDTSVLVNFVCTDADGDALTYSIVSNPANGVLSGSGSSRTYTPNADYNGSDSFTYQCNDGTVNSTVASAVITIAPVPDNAVWTATLQNKNVDEDSPAGTIVYANVVSLANDADGDPVVVSVAPTQGHFTLAIVGNNLVVNGLQTGNWYGSETVTLILNSGATQSFVFTVNQKLDEFFTIGGRTFWD